MERSMFTSFVRPSVFFSKRISHCAVAAITVLSTTSTSTTQAWTQLPKTFHSYPQEYPPSLQQTYRRMSTPAATKATTMVVAQFPCLSDNYGYLIHDPTTGATAAIDTPCGRTYTAELEKRGWTLTHILNTHHHHDHTGGNMELKKAFRDVSIVGPVNEQHKIQGIDLAVGAGDVFSVGSKQIRVMDGGGHTKGHIVYYIPDEATVFVGDCLFSLGCGRMFEGTKEQFWRSLEGLRKLPDDTLIYCAHEYTQNNGKFAMTVEPNNPELVAQVAIVNSKRARGEPTVPSLMGEEKKANPFLRVDVSDEIRKNIQVNNSDTPADAFRKLRKAKDNF